MSSVTERLGVTGKTYSTWAEDTCSPEFYFEPETYADVQQIVQAAGMAGKAVRVCATGHTLNRQSLTSGYLVNMKKLKKVLKVDKETCEVKVEAGAIMRDLNEKILPDNGLAFSVQASIDITTVGGCCTTAVHGTGDYYGGFSNYIVAMEMVLASGVIVEISRTNNTDLLPAARLSLGVLGIILNVTLQCEPAFTLHKGVHGVATTTLLENLESLKGCTDHLSIIIPGDNKFGKALCNLVSRNEKAVQSLPFDGASLVQSLSDRSDNIFVEKKEYHWSNVGYIMEWAVKRDDAKEIIAEFIQALNTLDMGAGTYIYCRFGGKDDLYISPAYDQDVLYIYSLILNTPEQKWDKLATKARINPVLAAIMAKYEARPVWSQYYDITSVDYSKLYPKWQDFLEVRQRLDPNTTFLNTELKKIFLSRNK